MEAGRPHSWKPSLLTELGRIPWDDVLIETARHLCRVKPRTRDGVVMIRQYRMSLEGREVKEVGTYDGLVDTLTAALNDYLTRFPHTSRDTVLSAIVALNIAVRDKNDA